MAQETGEVPTGRQRFIDYINSRTAGVKKDGNEARVRTGTLGPRAGGLTPSDQVLLFADEANGNTVGHTIVLRRNGGDAYALHAWASADGRLGEGFGDVRGVYQPIEDGDAVATNLVDQLMFLEHTGKLTWVRDQPSDS